MATITDAATAASTPDRDFILRAMQKAWEKFPQSKRIDFYKSTINVYDEPQTQVQADDALEGIADKAIITDGAFRNILYKLEDFANGHKDRYPELTWEWVPGWKKLYKDWSTVFKKSQDYATITASDYKERFVDVILELVGRVDLDNPESVKKEQDRLKRYSEENMPPTIPVDYEQAFKKLREDVARFQDKFNKYLEDKGEQIKEEIKCLEKELDVLVKELNGLNKAVDDWTIALATTSWIPLIGPLISGTGLAVETAKRNAKAREVDSKKREIERANQAQAGLAEIVTEFAALGGDFDVIDGTLQELTQIWSTMHASSVKFSYLLERAVNGGDDAEEFWLALESARKAADSLYSSLWSYATKVDGHRKACYAAGRAGDRY